MAINDKDVARKMEIEIESQRCIDLGHLLPIRNRNQKQGSGKGNIKKTENRKQKKEIEKQKQEKKTDKRQKKETEKQKQ